MLGSYFDKNIPHFSDLFIDNAKTLNAAIGLGKYGMSMFWVKILLP